MTELMEVGDRIGSGRYRLHSRFRKMLVFVRNAGPAQAPAYPELACVVEEGVAGPVNIVVRQLDFARADSLKVKPHRIILSGVALTIRQRYDSALRVGPLDADRLAGNLRVFQDALLELAPATSVVFLLREENFMGPFESGLAHRFRAGVERLRAGDLEGVTAMLRGLGRGLTPSGDDFLAGLLLGLHGLQLATQADFSRERRQIYCNADSANDFSRTLLRHAAEGWCLEPVKSLIETLFDGRKEDVAHQTQKLVAVGASSGADLGTGLAFALDHYSNQVAGKC